jgi:hypothetical protein
LITFASNDRLEISVDVTGDVIPIILQLYTLILYLDILLLAHFVHNSPSLRSHDQNWVPLCLPSLNAGGYVQVLATLSFSYVPTLNLLF